MMRTTALGRLHWDDYIERRETVKERDLQFDRTCHVCYTKPCKREIGEKIARHYPAKDREAVWEAVQRQYV